VLYQQESWQCRTSLLPAPVLSKIIVLAVEAPRPACSTAVLVVPLLARVRKVDRCGGATGSPAVSNQFSIGSLGSHHSVAPLVCDFSLHDALAQGRAKTDYLFDALQDRTDREQTLIPKDLRLPVGEAIGKRLTQLGYFIAWQCNSLVERRQNLIEMGANEIAKLN